MGAPEEEQKNTHSRRSLTRLFPHVRAAAAEDRSNLTYTEREKKRPNRVLVFNVPPSGAVRVCVCMIFAFPIPRADNRAAAATAASFAFMCSGLVFFCRFIQQAITLLNVPNEIGTRRHTAEGGKNRPRKGRFRLIRVVYALSRPLVQMVYEHVCVFCGLFFGGTLLFLLHSPRQRHF